MSEGVPTDNSRGYDALADAYMRARSAHIGAATVREWCRTLSPGSTVLDLGCGNGIPISSVMIEAGLTVYGVDASPAMIRAFQERFPQAHAECCAVEDSTLFGRTFDGVIAWGLLFLLPSELQASIIAKVAKVLKPGGRFLFTAPQAAVRWNDMMTDGESVSLGAETYEALLRAHGFSLIDNVFDEGENYYYVCIKTD